MQMPIPVKKGLRKLGNDIRAARIKRRITMDLMSKRASLSRTTLTKIEKGDPSVSLGHYAVVLFILGLIANMANLVDSNSDELGQSLEEENLPKRVRFAAQHLSLAVQKLRLATELVRSRKKKNIDDQ